MKHLQLVGFLILVFASLYILGWGLGKLIVGEPMENAPELTPAQKATHDKAIREAKPHEWQLPAYAGDRLCRVTLRDRPGLVLTGKVVGLACGMLELEEDKRKTFIKWDAVQLLTFDEEEK
jgi:hypothetical protein